jgi:hypothetical protein
MFQTMSIEMRASVAHIFFWETEFLLADEVGQH